MHYLYENISKKEYNVLKLALTSTFLVKGSHFIRTITSIIQFVPLALLQYTSFPDIRLPSPAMFLRPAERFFQNLLLNIRPLAGSPGTFFLPPAHHLQVLSAVL